MTERNRKIAALVITAPVAVPLIVAVLLVRAVIDGAFAWARIVSAATRPDQPQPQPARDYRAEAERLHSGEEPRISPPSKTTL